LIPARKFTNKLQVKIFGENPGYVIYKMYEKNIVRCGQSVSPLAVNILEHTFPISRVIMYT